MDFRNNDAPGYNKKVVTRTSSAMLLPVVFKCTVEVSCQNDDFTNTTYKHPFGSFCVVFKEWS